MKRVLCILLLASAMAACDRSTSTSSNPNPTPANTPPDNTAINSRDKNPDSGTNNVTAGNQGQNKNDVQLTADIRKRVVDAKLSTDAENCKIVAQGGKVTLRGPVKTQDEKESIGKAATEVAGAGNVDNQLEVIQNP